MTTTTRVTLSILLLAMGICAPIRGMAQLSRKGITTFFSDSIIPQVTDGEGWKTTLILVNLASNAVPFEIQFWSASGTPLAVPLAEYGVTERVSDEIPELGWAVIETLGTSNVLVQGWAELNSLEDIGAVAAFQNRNQNVDFVTTVPISSRFENNFIVPFDNNPSDEFVTTMAIVNPSSADAATVHMTLRGQKGDPICLESFETESPKGHRIECSLLGSSGFVDPLTDPRRQGCGCSIDLQTRERVTFILNQDALSDRRGVVEFFTDSAELAGLGFRFRTDGAFISFPPLSTIAR